MQFYGLTPEAAQWYLNRFVTVGYYALVDFSQTVPQSEGNKEVVEWIDHSAVPELILDHREILRRRLGHTSHRAQFDARRLQPAARKIHHTRVAKTLRNHTRTPARPPQFPPKNHGHWHPHQTRRKEKQCRTQSAQLLPF